MWADIPALAIPALPLRLELNLRHQGHGSYLSRIAISQITSANAGTYTWCVWSLRDASWTLTYSATLENTGHLASTVHGHHLRLILTSLVVHSVTYVCTRFSRVSLTSRIIVQESLNMNKNGYFQYASPENQSASLKPQHTIAATVSKPWKTMFYNNFF